MSFKIFKITGADSKTGADRSLRIRAKDELTALVLAKEQGVYPYKAERDEKAELIEAERTKAAELQDRELREAAERDRLILEQLVEIKSAMQNRLEKGKAVFLYETVYLPVNSVLMDEELNEGFDIPVLRRLGIDGWEVIQIIPRTVGIGLENLSVGSEVGQTWGGGSGGNIIGVHVILKKELALADVSDEDNAELFAYLRSNIESLIIE